MNCSYHLKYHPTTPNPSAEPHNSSHLHSNKSGSGRRGRLIPLSSCGLFKDRTSAFSSGTRSPSGFISVLITCNCIVVGD